MDEKIKLGISHGDVNSISYEVIMKSLMDTRMLDICTPVIYGSPKVAAYHKKALDIENFNLNNINNVGECKNGRVNIINCVDENIRVELGKSSESAGIASYLALEAATDDLRDNRIQALVTGPINKFNIQSKSFNYGGHTEYFKDRFGVEEVMMLMVSDIMKVGLVTTHVPIRELPEMITEELIYSKLKLMSHSLLTDFGIRGARIAVLGFNPHAGDSGLLGSEEERVIIPAINRAMEHNIYALGPFPADGFFGSGMFTKFDGILAMYHDQGLAPFKALSMDRGINFTAGLPVVRTSPAHGTAYELAGKNEANFESFRNAIYAACDIYHQRALYRELSKNPLPTGLTQEEGEDESPEDLEVREDRER
ncbi:MAG: 4-hydroxythreonine-4-phosphate dehydrogenase PdxA [Bacteroidales bacterium]|nr:4-hydroxythreonine-4-phosphate dehydrogenase PdxA [Bacteroidales bacterium]MBN2697736.1 4-hydroxythreonine-4-phosphate dehydrogenase PdxA [Bacteroidales bacterium]